MSKLQTLRNKLSGLRRRRAAVRWGTAWAGFGLAVLWVIVGAFLVDWLFAASVTQRIVLWAAGLAVLAWAYWRFSKPFLGHREGNEDVALLVERQQGIDSDLVAAMQFETAHGRASGSPQLETAVVDYVAEFSPGLDVYEGLDTGTFRKRAGLLAASLLAVLIAVGLGPAHASAFGNRMLLGRAHYPTEVEIETLTVNGTVVFPVSDAHAAKLEERRDEGLVAIDRSLVELEALHEAARTASNTSNGIWDSWFGPDEPVANAVRRIGRSRGEQQNVRSELEDFDVRGFVDAGRMLREQRRIARMLDELAGREDTEPIAEEIAKARTTAHAAVAAVGRMMPSVPYGQPLQLEVRAGGSDLGVPDAGRVTLTSLTGESRTEIDFETTYSGKGEGDYAATLPRMVDSVRYQLFFGDAWTDANTIAVVPLPSVTVELTATPPKYAADEIAPAAAGQLQQSVVEGSRVDLRVECTNKPLKSAVVTVDEKVYPLKQRDDAGRSWSLDVAGTPFADVREPIRFEVTVTDVDGLALERPIQGYLRIKSDRAPRITADIKYGLPIALPNATRTLDFRAGDDFGLSKVSLTMEIEKKDGTKSTDVRVLRRVEPTDQPTRELAGDYTLDFEPLGLELGDQMKITFEAVDYRGTLEPGSNVSEPIAFRVASESEVLREMQKHDVKAEQALDAIQRRELGIGESP